MHNTFDRHPVSATIHLETSLEDAETLRMEKKKGHSMEWNEEDDCPLKTVVTASTLHAGAGSFLKKNQAMQHCFKHVTFER